ncbi:hypothetical protein [Klebsiella phage phiKp_32]|nr:hypothetical protein [Klebsiella phage phiKp_32]
MNFLWAFLGFLLISIVVTVVLEVKRAGGKPIPKLSWKKGSFPAMPFISFIFGCLLGQYQNIWVCLIGLALVVVLLKTDFFFEEKD